tara:strand:+ start:4405 stop:5103 length:699 start_codon:yes stop_codon:yes gene_type:complete
MNPIIAKIEKLLRLSQDQDGTPEGETAARLASRMMAAHAIEMASINLDKEVEHDPMEKQDMRVRVSVWRRLLASTLGVHCNCQVAYTSHKGFGQHISMYGHRTDIELLKYLYDICERQIETEARRYVNNLDEWDRGTKKMLGNNFRRSAVTGLNSKLKDIRRDTQSENAEGFALVRSRKQKVDEWVKDNYSFRAGTSTNYGYNSAGYSAGRNVRLNAGVGSSGNRKQLGNNK